MPAFNPTGTSFASVCDWFSLVLAYAPFLSFPQDCTGPYGRRGASNEAGAEFAKKGPAARLEHAVKHWQPNRFGIDKFNIGAALLKTGHDIVRETDAHPVGAVGTVENENANSHRSLP
jgi:hypothetical protein